MTRVWAIILIMICGFNAFSVSDGSFFKEGESKLGFQQTSQQSSDDTASTDVLNVEHNDLDHHDDDCGQCSTSCRQCHLGHCSFILANSSIHLPDSSNSRFITDTQSYTSIDLATLQRPPLA